MEKGKYNILNFKLYYIIQGCDGNIKGVASLIKGMPIEKVKERLKGIKCGIRETSCPDQISKALDEYLKR